MAFRGWPAEALELYEGLLADNSKAYWTANKATYDECVRSPMVELLGELEPLLGAGKIFRPYRDVRFSADKTPYKTHIGALFEGGGYVQLSAAGLAAGRGAFHPEPDGLRRLRAAIDADSSGTALVDIVTALEKQGITLIARERLQTVPRGFDRDHPRAELLRYKGFAAWREWPVAAWLGTAKARRHLEEFFTTTQPLADWLGKHGV
jgi:uncharacterized protein (TIGR02453 family)